LNPIKGVIDFFSCHGLVKGFRKC